MVSVRSCWRARGEGRVDGGGVRQGDEVGFCCRLILNVLGIQEKETYS